LRFCGEGRAVDGIFDIAKNETMAGQELLAKGLSSFEFLCGIFEQIDPVCCGLHPPFLQIESPCPLEMSFYVLWG